ncbi:MAG: gamma-glutamylcyclotransferase [Planctomycetota bacterium]|jgi:gamma-glutamylcyclotransferase (GGCT)/AIG2-like uncharacterized protein YtfP|nr:gamma-glutamylcyclotransferase [Planctomycetota bacterium]
MATLESYSFRRPAKVDVSEWMGIVAGMRAELAELGAGNPGRRRIGEYVKKLLADARPLQNNPKMLFWGLAEPDTMPSDARVDFFYTPTYVAAAFLASSIMQYPEFLDEIPGLEETLRGALLACQGRKLQGHGYEGMSGTLEFFLKAGIHKFVKQYPGFCPSFTKLFRRSMAFVRRGSSRGGKRRLACPPSWFEDEDPARMDELLRLAGEDPEQMFLFVYGSLMRGNQARHLLDGTDLIGRATVRGYSLFDLGPYPAAVRERNGRVQGELYLIDQPTLERLTEYEGSLYNLERTAAAVHGGGRYPDVFIFVYNRPVDGAAKVPFAGQPWRAARREDGKEDCDG